MLIHLLGQWSVASNICDSYEFSYCKVSHLFWFLTFPTIIHWCILPRVPIKPTKPHCANRIRHRFVIWNVTYWSFSSSSWLGIIGFSKYLLFGVFCNIILATIRYILYYYCNFCQIKICIYGFFRLKYNSRLRLSTAAEYFIINKTAPHNNYGSDAKITKNSEAVQRCLPVWAKGVTREQRPAKKCVVVNWNWRKRNSLRKRI